MLLMFKTLKGVRHLDWALYAVLRDNVQHYLESAPGCPSFHALHEVERVVDGGVKYLHALDLRREVLRAWCALAWLPLSESAISLRTRALLTGQEPPFVRGTLKARAQGWRLPIPGHLNRMFRDVIGPFVEEILFLTDLASPLDDLCVMRVDTPNHAGDENARP